MKKGSLSIHSENILPIIKRWLYSDKDIFIRELVSNATDAIRKRSIVSGEQNTLFDLSQARIDISINKAQKTIEIRDTGLGMTGEEVEKYIAQLAFSGAEEFVKKYSSAAESDQIIGHFGLGFYSAFMVSSKVEINTLSFLDGAESAFWSCDGSSDYELSKGSRTEVGTTITLYLNEDSQEYLEESKLSEILKRHCLFLPYPLFLEGKQINEKEPLWIKKPSEITDESYLEFYRYLYPMEPDPVFWIHLNVDYPFHLKGILYFPKITRRFDFSKPQVDLYCNRVFVSDNCKDIMPEYLTMLRGIVDSPDIPLNVSRSYLQVDPTVRQLSSHIAKKVADKLSSLQKESPQTIEEKWGDLEAVVKLGCLQDEKFYEKVKGALLWKTAEGSFTTLEAHIEKSGKKVFYTTTEDKTPFQELFSKKGIPVLVAHHYLDTPLMSFLESKLSDVTFKRIDGEIHSEILEELQEAAADSEGKTVASTIAELFTAHTGISHVEAKSLSSSDLPAFVMMKEEIRRMRDYLMMTSGEKPPFYKDEHTLVVNTNHKLIQGLSALAEKNPELCKDASMHVYELALLMQKELDPSKLPGFIERSTRILTELAKA